MFGLNLHGPPIVWPTHMHTTERSMPPWQMNRPTDRPLTVTYSGKKRNACLSVFPLTGSHEPAVAQLAQQQGRTFSIQ